MMDNYCKYIYYGAAQSGNLSLFKSMKSLGYPFNRKACTIVAENGHLNIIEWILSEIRIWNEFNEEVYNDWITSVISPAATSKGHLHILKMLPRVTHWEKTVKTALQNGQVEVLKWLQANNHIDVNSSLITYSGNLNVLIWLQNEYSVDWNWQATMYKAISIGDPDMIDYLEKKNVEFDAYCYELAAEFGHFEIIKWLYEKQCEWNLDVTSTAAENGNLSMLQWFIAKKCPVNLMKIARCAVNGGNLQLIEWLDLNFSIEWENSLLCALAVSNSRWDIVEWLLAKNCQVQKGTLAKAIKKGAGFNILKQLFYGEVDTDWDNICETAGSYGKFDFLEWIPNEINTSICNIAWSAYYGAMMKNQFGYMKKVYSNHCVCIESMTRCVANPLYEWLKKQECVQ